LIVIGDERRGIVDVTEVEPRGRELGFIERLHGLAERAPRSFTSGGVCFEIVRQRGLGELLLMTHREPRDLLGYGSALCFVRGENALISPAAQMRAERPGEVENIGDS